MGFADFYFEKQKNFKVKIEDEPKQNLKYILVIPCYYEFNLLETLNSIWISERSGFSIEVIIIINSAENSDQKTKDQNIKTYNEVKNWMVNHEDSLLRFFVLLEENLPKKYAGAGLARKIGMDQAIARFNQINRKDGVIVSIDADSKLKPNYFTELEKHFSRHPKTNVITTYFEHPVEGNEFDPSIYSAIIIYELYLRYYKLVLSYSGFPYSFYTIGSCFAVNANTYVKQGGMNRKQAGEDFYFLHKVFPLGDCHEINTTCVYPSSRPSNRVPFGTGPMVKSISEMGDNEFLTYNFNAFLELKSFFGRTNELFKITENSLQKFVSSLPKSISEFLNQNDFTEAIHEINQNSSNIKTFTRRYFNWFDAFRVLKYLNYSHEKYFDKKPLFKEAGKLYKLISRENLNETDYRGLLERYRKLERQF